MLPSEIMIWQPEFTDKILSRKPGAVQWVEKAAEQCIQQRQTVVMLVPEDMSVGWFSKALESVDEVRIITDGRINFIEPSTGLEKKGNSKGSMLLIWRPFISPRRMFTTVSKAALMAIGQGVRRAA
ncbi:phage N-6-adenine-methyltransferase [Escherichia coli]|nr:phage N-6-adenine-methyltransferase [Escherichia coli]